MTLPAGTFARDGFVRGHLPEIVFVAASITWAVVMIDAGDIAWPLAVWVSTALAPMSLLRLRRRAESATPHHR